MISCGGGLQHSRAGCRRRRSRLEEEVGVSTEGTSDLGRMLLTVLWTAAAATRLSDPLRKGPERLDVGDVVRYALLRHCLPFLGAGIKRGTPVDPSRRAGKALNGW